MVKNRKKSGQSSSSNKAAEDGQPPIKDLLTGKADPIRKPFVSKLANMSMDDLERQVARDRAVHGNDHNVVLRVLFTVESLRNNTGKVKIIPPDRSLVGYDEAFVFEFRGVFGEMYIWMAAIQNTDKNLSLEWAANIEYAMKHIAERTGGSFPDEGMNWQPVPDAPSVKPTMH